ncbi:uncharacterized protein LOC114259005 [Camellia sinensis]|uniref:uncharacterized protein LOC114259005 n=1 Tax=Camellia sinensis TaxID=4442 RepID=UPI001035F106|nr:uncharacterized protein LOC114259005 [Camellia sinensis]
MTTTSKSSSFALLSTIPPHVEPTCFSGFKYYVLFIDESSKFTWVYPLCYKSEVFAKFMEFKVFVENQFETTLENFRTDGGGEYTSCSFEIFLRTHGIIHQMCCPHTFSQNGVAERKHRHIVTTSIALLRQLGLSLAYWFDVLAISVFLINRLPSSKLQNQTPYEIALAFVQPAAVSIKPSIIFFQPSAPAVSALSEAIAPASVQPFVVSIQPSVVSFKLSAPALAVVQPTAAPGLPTAATVFPGLLATALSPSLAVSPSIPISSLTIDLPFVHHIYAFPAPSYSSLNIHPMTTTSKSSSFALLSTISPHVEPTCFSGFKYYVLFIDESSKFTWVYPLCYKSEVFAKFMEFKVFIENQFETTLENFRTDGGGEKTFIQCNLQRTSTTVTFLLIYVDDILITGNSADHITSLFHHMHKAFSMNELGDISYLLGISIACIASSLLLSQPKYATNILNMAGMINCKPCSSPMASKSNPLSDTLVTFSQLSLYRSIVGALHFMTYSPKKKKIGLLFTPGSLDLHAFSDSDWARDVLDRKSTIGYCVFLGPNLILWSAKKQSTISRSSTEAECRALAQASAELQWLRMLLQELSLSFATLSVVIVF